jgi:predicted RNA-binding Zn-ribbon protein involved in translation (DUF1610 family)
MPTIVTCSCGARVRLPEGARGQAFRCPQCKAEIQTTVDAKVLSAYRARPGLPEATCPICQSTIAATEAAVTCPDCDQVHHQDCWREVGGCSTYGCPQAPALAKDAPASAPLTAWGDTKKCPVCGESIKSIALRCRYCGTDFDTVDPLKLADLRRGAKKAETLEGLRKTIVALFVVSLTGCLAPLALIVGLIVLIPKRHDVVRAGPLFVVLSYATIALATLYSVLLLLFVVFQ